MSAARRICFSPFLIFETQRTPETVFRKITNFDWTDFDVDCCGATRPAVWGVDAWQGSCDGRIRPSAVDALCAENSSNLERRWPSCLILGLPKKRLYGRPR
jgi:hypothetical protein